MVPSGVQTVQAIFLGPTSITECGSCLTLDTPSIVNANGDWALQTFPGTISEDVVASYGTDNGDGTATFRMWAAAAPCPSAAVFCYNAATPSPSFTWYVDEVRVVQTSTPTPTPTPSS